MWQLGSLSGECPSCDQSLDDLDQCVEADQKKQAVVGQCPLNPQMDPSPDETPTRCEVTGRLSQAESAVGLSGNGRRAGGEAVVSEGNDWAVHC